MKPQDLPIYRVTYELMHHVTQITRHFPRNLRASLAGRIQSECVDLVLNVYRANAARDRKDRGRQIQRILEGVQVLEMMLRLSMDMRLISVGHHARAAELTDAVGRQAYGWLKSTQ